jgi:hypothetical protein
LSAYYYAISSSATNQTTLFTSQSVYQGANTQTQVYSFSPTYPGIISISGTSSSTTGYIRIVNNTTGTSANYSFGTGATVTVPVTLSGMYYH